jgi:hypothetical protein
MGQHRVHRKSHQDQVTHQASQATYVLQKNQRRETGYFDSGSFQLVEIPLTKLST